MKAIVFSQYFEAPDELDNYCTELGYKEPDYTSPDIMFDQRIIDFCQERFYKSTGSEGCYIGRPSKDFLCGYAGAGYIRYIDTSRLWHIDFNLGRGTPTIQYLNIIINDHNQVIIEKD